jgi:RNA polymerase sigma factor (sigma-70 family)
MVLGLCQRLLGHAQDAEDAFQATFLVLARKARCITPPDKVGSWLYGVAYQTARKARARAVRRYARERPLAGAEEPAFVPREPLLADDLRCLLDQELSYLPDPYRLPLLLCDLQGKTRRQAAAQLGWPEGTLAGRLFRARRRLAARLARRGLVPSATALAILGAQQATAAIRPALAFSTIQAASLLAAHPLAAGAVSVPVAALTQGVLKTMLIERMKKVLAVVLVVAVGGGGLGVCLRSTTTQASSPQESRPAVAAARQQDRPPPPQPRPEERIQRILDAPVDMGFKDQPLRNVIEDLRAFTSIPLLVDEPALRRAGISLETPISLGVHQVSLRTAMNLLCHRVGLRLKIDRGGIVLTTEESPVFRGKKGLAGVWRVLCYTSDKGMFSPPATARDTWTFSQRSLDIRVGDSCVAFSYLCGTDGRGEKNRIQLSLLGKAFPGHYVVDEDTLVLWLDTPLKFLDGVRVVVLKRAPR